MSSNSCLITPYGIPSVRLSSDSALATPAATIAITATTVAVTLLIRMVFQEVASDSQVAQKMVMLIKPFIEKNEALILDRSEGLTIRC